MVLPPAHHGDQRRISSSLEVRGTMAEVAESVDGFGNVGVVVRAARGQERVEFVVRVVVERHDGPGAAAGRADRFRLLDASPLTEPDAALVLAARRLLGRATAASPWPGASAPGWRAPCATAMT